MFLVAKWLHIAIASAWFGHKLLVPADLRQISTATPEFARASLPRIERAERLGIVTGVGTLLTGGWLVFLVGPSVVQPTIYMGLGLVLVAIALGALVARPASLRFRRAVTEADRDAAERSAGTLSMVLTLEAVLWTGALLTMLI